MRDGTFVRLKDDSPNFWNLIPGKVYVVQDTKYLGGQSFVVLRNSRGKCRRYYEHLFEAIKVTETNDSRIEQLKQTWLYTKGAASKAAYAELERLDAELDQTLPFKKGVKVRFKKGVEAGRFENRVFTIAADPQNGAFLKRHVKLAGLYGCYDMDNLEITEEPA